MIQVYYPDKTLVNMVITAQREPIWGHGINAPKNLRRRAETEQLVVDDDSLCVTYTTFLYPVKIDLRYGDIKKFRVDPDKHQVLIFAKDKTILLYAWYKDMDRILGTIRKGMQTPGDEKSPSSKKEEEKWDRL